MSNKVCNNTTGQDWHLEDIKAALHKAGISLASIAKAHGLNGSSTLSSTFTRSYPKNEARIANALGLHPMVLWPSRYKPDGTPAKRGFLAVQFSAVTISEQKLD